MQYVLLGEKGVGQHAGVVLASSRVRTDAVEASIGAGDGHHVDGSLLVPVYVMFLVCCWHPQVYVAAVDSA